MKRLACMLATVGVLAAPAASVAAPNIAWGTFACIGSNAYVSPPTISGAAPGWYALYAGIADANNGWRFFAHDGPYYINHSAGGYDLIYDRQDQLVTNAFDTKPFSTWNNISGTVGFGEFIYDYSTRQWYASYIKENNGVYWACHV
jgi:hypothetical protein